MKNTWKKIVFALLTMISIESSAFAESASQPSQADRIKELESMVNHLIHEVQTLKKNQEQTSAVAVSSTAAPETLSSDEISSLKKIASGYESNPQIFERGPSWYDKLSLGGYGEMHFNFSEGDGKDKSDLHRLVLTTDYQFEDWLHFVGEFEIEHGYVDDDNGELVVEQAYAEAAISDKLNLRIGRVLAPLGYINANHEPTLFNGVERPTFYRVMVPSTWSVDGIGATGSLNEYISWEAYIAGSLDGSKFDYSGIRGGRIKQEPSMHSPAFTGRVDIYPLAGKEMTNDQQLRLGFSTFVGGLDNTNGGGSNDISSDIALGVFDYHHTIGRLDLIGALAYTHISDAEEMASKNVAEEMLGWYQEVACRIMPAAWKKGRLENSELTAFVRYDWFDTQYSMPANLKADERGRYDEFTFGLTFHVTPQFVLKTDYQIREDKAGSDLGDLINLGVGFSF